MTMLFPLGDLYTTPGAARLLEPTQIWTYLSRHASGDWGDLCAEDKAENDLSVKEGFRIMSAYTLDSGAKVWIVTEADRSATTILLPDEY